MLELPDDAPIQEVKNAYRRLAVRYHPDKCEENDNGDAFKRINSAYQILSDPRKKAEYDYYGDGASMRQFAKRCIKYPSSSGIVGDSAGCSYYRCITEAPHLDFDDDDEFGCFNASSAEDFLFGRGFHFFFRSGLSLVVPNPENLGKMSAVECVQSDSRTKHTKILEHGSDNHLKISVDVGEHWNKLGNFGAFGTPRLQPMQLPRLRCAYCHCHQTHYRGRVYVVWTYVGCLVCVAAITISVVMAVVAAAAGVGRFVAR